MNCAHDGLVAGQAVTGNVFGAMINKDNCAVPKEDYQGAH